MMFHGTTIAELFEIVERAEEHARQADEPVPATELAIAYWAQPQRSSSFVYEVA